MDKLISDNKIFIIAETAFSHEGNFDYLCSQINVAAKAGVDYIKFQIIINKFSVYVADHPLYNLIDSWMFSADQWIKALTMAKNLGLKTIVLPIDTDSIDLCSKFNDLVDIYEVHSICFNDEILLKKLSKQNQVKILGVGGHYKIDIEKAYKLSNSDDNTIIMYGFQSFPTDPSKLELNKLDSLKKVFNCNLGFADHSAHDSDNYLNLNNTAYLLGCRYFEKHIVLNKGEKRTDFESAIDLKDFINMRESLNFFTASLGSTDLNYLNDKELSYRSRQKKALTASDIQVGTIIDEAKIIFKLTPEYSNFSTNYEQNFIGRIAKNNIPAGSCFKLEDFE